jgi:hypothetical protein
MSYSDIKLGIDSDADKVILIPCEYPTGWIFEQAVTDDKEAVINYEPSLWVPRTVSLYAVSSDGRYYGKKTVMLDVKKDPYSSLVGIIALIFRILL